MRQEKAFPLTPEDMIARSKAFLESRGGFGADPDLIADDFNYALLLLLLLGLATGALLLRKAAQAKNLAIQWV